MVRITTRHGDDKPRLQRCLIAAVQEVSVLSNAFSAEYGWTLWSSIELRQLSREQMMYMVKDLFLYRPGGWQAETFSTRWLLSTISSHSCVNAINAATQSIPSDIPDQLSQVSGTIGGPVVKRQNFLLCVCLTTLDQNRTTFLSTYVAMLSSCHLMEVSIGPVITVSFSLTAVSITSSLPNQNLMLRFNVDRFVRRQSRRMRSVAQTRRASLADTATQVLDRFR